MLGYAENATALAHLVADWSARRPRRAHHAAGRRRRVRARRPRRAAQPRAAARARARRPGALDPRPAAGLVDDELTTGKDRCDDLVPLLPNHLLPRRRYLVATLADLRGHADDAVEPVTHDLGVRVDVVASARSRLDLPPDVLDRAAHLLRTWEDGTVRPQGRAETGDLAPPARRRGRGRATRVRPRRTADRPGAAPIPGAAATLADALGPRPGRVLVLGCEELHYLPLRLAETLAAGGADVHLAATTRSPLVARDVAGYPVRSGLAFAAHDVALGHAPERYVYGLGAHGRGLYDTVVLVVDAAARTPVLRRPDGLLSRLGAVTARIVEAALPCRGPGSAGPPVRMQAAAARRGPEFGSFARDEVGWLLSDLSAVALETPTAEREAALGTGRLHYSQSLPQEPVPAPAYERVVARALERSAAPVAGAVGVLADRVLALRGRGAVLVSLARAGTPVGVLVRRWAARVRGVVLPHYAMSVLRGRGLDRAALDALVAAHDPAALVLVDAWTGAGGIVDEVAADLARYARETGVVVDPTVAVLADPAHRATLYGSREDLLVPQACLNATVGGLVSRTVDRPDLLPPGSYQGAKSYPGLAGVDRTATFLDAVSAHFPTGRPPAAALPSDPGDDARGPRYLAALAVDLGVTDPRRLRPGIGETTRALLRRDPGAVHLAPDAGPDLDPVRHLCAERGVPIRPLPDPVAGLRSPYRCVGVLRPWRAG